MRRCKWSRHSSVNIGGRIIASGEERTAHNQSRSRNWRSLSPRLKFADLTMGAGSDSKVRRIISKSVPGRSGCLHNAQTTAPPSVGHCDCEHCFVARFPGNLERSERCGRSAGSTANRKRDACGRLQEAQEQAECITIGGNSSGTDVTLPDQMFGEEAWE